jgi:hypothetical protein
MSTPHRYFPALFVLSLGLPIATWAAVLMSSLLPFHGVLTFLVGSRPGGLTLLAWLWLLVVASMLGAWALERHTFTRRPTRLLAGGLWSLLPLVALGGVMIINAPHTEGLVFLLLIPALIATPIALVTLVIAFSTGKAWHSVSNNEVVA